MTVDKDVQRVPEGLGFYFTVGLPVDATCFQTAGTDGGDPFDLSAAYFESYHQMTEIHLYYDSQLKYVQGMEVRRFHLYNI